MSVVCWTPKPAFSVASSPLLEKSPRDGSKKLIQMTRSLFQANSTYRLEKGLGSRELRNPKDKLQVASFYNQGSQWLPGMLLS